MNTDIKNKVIGGDMTGAARTFDLSRLTALYDNNEAEKGEPQLQNKRGDT